jgi:hypothetical protein
MFVLFAVLWIIIGHASTTTPGPPRPVWVFAALLPAGSALAAAWHLTRTALRTYVGAVALVGFARASAFIFDDSVTFAPAAVWMLMGATTGLLYVEVERTTRTELR